MGNKIYECPHERVEKFNYCRQRRSVIWTSILKDILYNNILKKLSTQQVILEFKPRKAPKNIL